MHIEPAAGKFKTRTLNSKGCGTRRTIKKKRPGGSETRPCGEWRMNVDLRFMWGGGVCAKMLGEA